MHSFNKSISGPSRTGKTSARMFQPYGASSARETAHRNLDASTPTIALPGALCAGLETSQPTRGLTPETTAEAEIKQIITKEQEAQVNHFYRPCILSVID